MKHIHIIIYIVLLSSCRSAVRSRSGEFRIKTDSIVYHNKIKNDEINIRHIEQRLFYSPPNDSGRQHITHSIIIERDGRHRSVAEVETKQQTSMQNELKEENVVMVKPRRYSNICLIIIAFFLVITLCKLFRNATNLL